MGELTERTKRLTAHANFQLPISRFSSPLLYPNSGSVRSMLDTKYNGYGYVLVSYMHARAFEH